MELYTVSPVKPYCLGILRSLFVLIARLSRFGRSRGDYGGLIAATPCVYRRRFVH